MTRPAMLPRAAMILLAMACAACGPERLRIALPPADLATCADEPRAPDLPRADGSAEIQRLRDLLTLNYVLALRGAWGDCKSRVDGLRAWRDEAGR